MIEFDVLKKRLTEAIAWHQISISAIAAETNFRDLPLFNPYSSEGRCLPAEYEKLKIVTKFIFLIRERRLKQRRPGVFPIPDLARLCA